ncbi:hypothetical protein [Deinococcus sp. SL84]|uniref:hypothetical protein n=1 Tax=Deinococcus sp. SL84 TaxID=2994663 RepID=UPI0022758561|nr:hypothetical protein [Deinococcus sp. SL84]MCY1703686.1 hypothetical protein [Deinococcus sp. SL84]
MTHLTLPIPEGPHTLKLLERYLQALTLQQDGTTAPSFVRSERTLLRLAHQLSALSRVPLHRISGKTNKRLSLSAEQFEMLARVIVRQETEGHSYDDLLREELGLASAFRVGESSVGVTATGPQAGETEVVEVIERLEKTVKELKGLVTAQGERVVWLQQHIYHLTNLMEKTLDHPELVAESRKKFLGEDAPMTGSVPNQSEPHSP